MVRKLSLLLFVVLLSLTALVACGGQEKTTEVPVEDVAVVMKDIHFGATNDNATNPPVWNATTGATVKLALDNQGALEHNWAIVKTGATLPDSVTDAGAIAEMLIWDAGSVAAGEKTTKVFTAPAAGEYVVICTIAGHYPAMQGKLIVK